MTTISKFQRTLSSNVKAGPKIRHDVLLRKALLFDPGFADLLGPEQITASGIADDIGRLGESVATFIDAINATRSASTRNELFMITPKTHTALREIAEPIGDFDSYKNLIDNLFFVFHEGVGARPSDQALFV